MTLSIISFLLSARNIWSCGHHCLWDRPASLSKRFLQWNHWSCWGWWFCQHWVCFPCLPWNCPTCLFWSMDTWPNTKLIQGIFFLTCIYCKQCTPLHVIQTGIFMIHLTFIWYSWLYLSNLTIPVLAWNSPIAIACVEISVQWNLEFTSLWRF